MSCGEWCVFYKDKGKTSACQGCSYYESKRSRFELGKVDAFKLGRLLVEKQERERKIKNPQLFDCPDCHQHSLFYNSIDDRLECLNVVGHCERSTSYILSGTPEYKSIMG